jgi:serine protease Do
VELGSSEDLRVGDTAFTVGAPLDNAYSWTVTRGIISGKNRMVEVELSSSSGDYVMNVLQTDAAINSGNSGGPLCNANGEVVGITSLKLVEESIEGMGFAIPIERALEYAEKLIKGEEITQPYIGISMVNVADAYYDLKYYNMLTKYNITSGVVILGVERGSAAEKAGLSVGDVIIKVNNDQVSSIGYFRYYLYNYNPGDNVQITYIRNGEEKVTTATLGTNKKLY